MKVHELIELLQACDPTAEVLLATQPSWPFEAAIDGVVTRAEVELTERGFVRDDALTREPPTLPNDVLLVEGSQLRYGSKATWRVLER